ncbi:hypothetical protein Tco_0214419 [Tanacetum coccineum]
MTEFALRVWQDIDEIYMRLDDEQTERQLMAGRLNMLYRDRRAHARTEVMSMRSTVLGQQAVITELQAADRRRQAAITELLAADRKETCHNVPLRHKATKETSEPRRHSSETAGSR